MLIGCQKRLTRHNFNGCLQGDNDVTLRWFQLWKQCWKKLFLRSVKPLNGCHSTESDKKNSSIIVIVTKLIKSCLLSCFGTFKMPILMFISILVFCPEGQIWNPVRRVTKIYVQRILNASRISTNHLNSSTINQSWKEIVRFSKVDFHKLKWSRKW